MIHNLFWKLSVDRDENESVVFVQGDGRNQRHLTEDEIQNIENDDDILVTERYYDLCADGKKRECQAYFKKRTWSDKILEECKSNWDEVIINEYVLIFEISGVLRTRTPPLTRKPLVSRDFGTRGGSCT